MSAMSERAAEIDRLMADMSFSDRRRLAQRLAGELGCVLEPRPARPDHAHLRSAVPDRAETGRSIAELRKVWAESSVQFAIEAHRLLRTCEMAVSVLMARHVNSAHDDFHNADNLVETIATFCDVGDSARWLELHDTTEDALGVWLAQHRDLEISWGASDEEADPAWQVHRVNGGVNDREWTLIGSGKTPVDALSAARATLVRKGAG